MSSDDSIGRVAVFGGASPRGRPAGGDARGRPQSRCGSYSRGAYCCLRRVRDETSVALALEGCCAALDAAGHYVGKGTTTFLRCVSWAHATLLSRGKLERLRPLLGRLNSGWSPQRSSYLYAACWMTDSCQPSGGRDRHDGMSRTPLLR
jgi:hypothetical protein